MINDIMIQSFLTLAETLNFTNAARQLFLSQQAVSKHISKLEEDLDCQLFSRNRGNIHLTAAGKIYLDVFTQYNENMKQAEYLVHGKTAAEQKKITIGYLDLLDINSILGPIIMKFKNEHPDIIIEYRSSQDWELPTLLKDHKVDLSITFDAEVSEDAPVESVPLMVAREVLFVSKNHPLATASANYLDFKNETVFFSLPPSGNVAHLLKRLDSQGFPYDNLVCTENMLSSCTAIDMMQGVSFAIEHSRVLEQGVYATYPTDCKVKILLCMENMNPKTYVRLFMESAKASSQLIQNIEQ